MLLFLRNSLILTGIYERGKKTVFKLVQRIPSVRHQIDKEISNIEQTFEDQMVSRMQDIDFITNLPERSMASEEILKNVIKYMKLGKRIQSQFSTEKNLKLYTLCTKFCFLFRYVRLERWQGVGNCLYLRQRSDKAHVRCIRIGFVHKSTSS